MKEQKERKHLRSLTKPLGLTGLVLVPATSEPDFDLSLASSTQRHQTNYFTLKKMGGKNR